MVVDITKDNTTKSYYQVKDIAYDDTSITKLVVINKKTKEVVISYGSSEKVSKTTDLTPKNENHESKPLTDFQKNKLQDYVGRLSGDKYKPFFDWLFQTYGVNNVADLTEDKAQDCIGKLRIK